MVKTKTKPVMAFTNVPTPKQEAAAKRSSERLMAAISKLAGRIKKQASRRPKTSQPAAGKVRRHPSSGAKGTGKTARGRSRR